LGVHKTATIMSTQTGVQTAPKKSGIEILKATLKADSVTEQFRNALKDNSGPFTASIIDLYNSDNNLQACDPNKVVMEALKAAVLKLPINKSLGFAYIVPFNNSVKNTDGSWSKVMTPTMIIGYKGLIQLAMRTGQYKTINADVVYKGELRKVDKLSGEIDFTGERESDEVVGYFCYFKLTNGFEKTLYMSVEDMAKYAKQYSPSIGKDTTVEILIKTAKANQVSKNVGWMGNFTNQALKTCTRRLLSKYGYLSIEMQQAIAEEQEPTESRDENIQQHANTVKVDIQDVKFEEVKSDDTATDNTSDEPNY
jgi:recombination protein RecT